MNAVAPQPPPVTDFVEARSLDRLIEAARREDLGPAGLDVTSSLCIPEALEREARIVAREGGRLAGAALLATIARTYDHAVAVSTCKDDGAGLEPGDIIATLTGPLRSLLMIERVALNFLGHLSGIASLTAQYASAVRETPAHILDTRKTLPGLRGLAKYAVVCGGGRSHRTGLYDAMLIKDNHLAHVPSDQLRDHLAAIITNAREHYPDLRFIEVEVDTLAQLEAVLSLDADIVLLDNMPPGTLREAVATRDRERPGVVLEASGGVNLDTVRDIAETGVDRISIGALTHSARALDVGMDLP